MLWCLRRRFPKSVKIVFSIWQLQYCRRFDNFLSLQLVYFIVVLKNMLFVHTITYVVFFCCMKHIFLRNTLSAYQMFWFCNVIFMQHIWGLFIHSTLTPTMLEVGLQCNARRHFFENSRHLLYIRYRQSDRIFPEYCDWKTPCVDQQDTQFYISCQQIIN